MSEMIGIGVVCLVLGLIVGATMAYDKGFQAGVSWAHFNIFGRES